MDTLDLTRAITYLLMPLSVGLGLVLLGALIEWRRSTAWGRLTMLVGVAVIWVFSTPVVPNFLAHNLEARYPPLSADSCGRADAIVVLGGAMRPAVDHDPVPRLDEASDRLWQAARLYDADCAPLVFVAGGGHVEPPVLTKESVAMLAFLRDYGIPESALLSEDRSRNTTGNAQEAWAELSKRGVRRIHLVTSAWHMRRAEREFERAGFAVLPAPADYRSFGLKPGLRAWLPDPEALVLSHLIVKEYLGWWWGSLVSGVA